MRFSELRVLLDGGLGRAEGEEGREGGVGEAVADVVRDGDGLEFGERTDFGPFLLSDFLELCIHCLGRKSERR